MTENYIVFVQDNNMLSILSGADIEHPYRFQPYVTFVIQQSEYKKFVRMMTGLSVSWLRFKKEMYKGVLLSNDETLWTKLFLFDVSKAIINEVVMAVANNEEATVILHNFDDCDCETISMEDVDVELLKLPKEICTKAVESISRDIQIYINFAAISKHNKSLLHYAILLRARCFTESLNKLNINLTE